MSIWIKKALCKIGLYSFSVDILHKSYLKGHIGQADLYKLLKPNQLEKFIKHHASVKSSFERSEQLGLTKTDELHEEVQDLINSPLTQALLTMNGDITTTSEERSRMVAALNQLDGKIIHGILEKEVLAAHGRKNVIMDQGDFD